MEFFLPLQQLEIYPMHRRQSEPHSLFQQREEEILNLTGVRTPRPFGRPARSESLF
jgi:hypothetical protein